MNNLLIIESPNKINTISKYLSDGNYEIIATIGHVRDLSSRGLGFDKETLEPNWVIPSSKKRQVPTKQIIENIKTAAKKADIIYLATDPDREGEAISWHVFELLSKADQDKCKRITFNEITKTAITESLNKARDLDMPWIQSQFSRRILDRLVGFELSNLVRKKVRGRSAGRVQSVALNFIYDREKEIRAFKETKWWTVDPKINEKSSLVLREINKNIPGLNFKKISSDTEGSGVDFYDIKSAELVKNNLTTKYKIYKVEQPKQIKSNSKEPYKTSTLQQDAINRLYWNINKVSSVSQKLYEGVKIDSEYVALISYPRTDSIRISATFQARVKDYIVKKYGDKYHAEKNYGFGATKGKNTQDAHEAIRVIDPFITPISIKNKVSKEEYALYNLIWSRTLSAFMSAAIYENRIIRIINNDNKFYTYSRQLIFDGYRVLYSKDDELPLRSLNYDENSIGKDFKIQEVLIKEHVTSPPPRFNQASLVKELDSKGVGRPSTYNSMANMSLQRGYAELQSRAYHLLPLGEEVIDFLKEFFPFVIDEEFTSRIEAFLDKIADGELDWKYPIRSTQEKLVKELDNAKKNAKVVAVTVGKKCPKCNSDLVYRYSNKNGAKFIGCGDYPKCKYVEFPNAAAPVALDEDCPKCGKKLVLKVSKYKKHFIGCGGYPACHFIKVLPYNEIKKIVEELEASDSNKN